MSASSTITTVWTTHGSQFIAHEMLTARAAMSAPAKYFNLVYKIRLIHCGTKVRLVVE